MTMDGMYDKSNKFNQQYICFSSAENCIKECIETVIDCWNSYIIYNTF